MITIYPLKYTELQKYYNSFTFTLNELSLLLNVKGFYKGKKIDKNIAISKNRLYTSKTVLNNSLTLFYTFVRVDLDDFTYTSSNITFNSMDPDKPEFLLYLDDDYNCVNNSMTILSNTYISGTVALSLTSLYSLSSNFSNSAITSLTSLFSLTAAYCINSSKKINLFDIPYTRLFVDTKFPTNVNEYDSFYNIKSKKLYVYRFNTWNEIDWKQYIISDILYKEDLLRINNKTGALEVSPYSNWYEIIPTIGTIFEPVNNTDYVYYIAAEQTYVGKSSSIAPIMIARDDLYFTGTFYYNHSGTGYFGLYPFSTTLDNAFGSFITGGTTSCSVIDFDDFKYIPIFYQSNSINHGQFNIYKRGTSFIYAFSNALDTLNNNVIVLTSGGYYLSDEMYYLGTWCLNGIPITVDRITLKRLF